MASKKESQVKQQKKHLLKMKMLKQYKKKVKAEISFPQLQSYIDQLQQKGFLTKNKASRLISKLHIKHT